ncbi:MAG: cupin domain-containing protein [Hydrogenothermus sp.]|nr:MAG: cupin domain-containing protein [Hydrogenothermus sp.]
MKIKIDFNFSEEKPITKRLFANKDMIIVHFYLKSGQKIPMHASPSTVLVSVLEGKGKFFIDNEDNFEILEKGESFIYNPKQPHGFLALEDMIVQAVIAPNPSISKINIEK